MPVELHERLSEFSYGYGVTREVERRLRRQGLAVTPFLPSLLHEAKLGFDVGFNRAGTPLLLQFKLGQALRRFVPGPRPQLDQPFWRYRIDTAEPDGQFELLLKAEMDGADVFYVAPKFHDWELYLDAFENRRILGKSVIVKPSEIRRVLSLNGVPDGDHKIVYDRSNAYVCSEPLEIEAVKSAEFAAQVRAQVEAREIPLGTILERVFEGFADRTAIRSERFARSTDLDRLSYAIPSDQGRQPGLRGERLARIRASGRTREEAIALVVGAEAWSSGAQLIFVTETAKAP